MMKTEVGNTVEFVRNFVIPTRVNKYMATEDLLPEEKIIPTIRIVKGPSG